MKEKTMLFKRRSISIDDKMWEELRKAAVKEQRSISQLVRLILSKKINEYQNYDII